MIVLIEFFKPSGKWYASEFVEIDRIDGVNDKPWLRTKLRFRNMHAVFTMPNPWGFPLMITAETNQ